MLTAIVTFQLPNPVTLEEARQTFLSTAPKYLDVPGLIRKHYMLSQDGCTAGGVYLWHSKEAADKMFTDNWRVFVREKYGTEPSVTYMDSPVLVDNLLHEIIET